MNAKRVVKRIVAGAMKRWLEEVSVDMGLDGEINDDVIAEGQRRLDGAGDTAGSTDAAPAKPKPIGGPLPDAKGLLENLPDIDGTRPAA